MTSLSREARIYLALWRKTATEPEGFEVKFPTESLAISARQGLYRAIKSFRNRPDLDPILAEAADKFVVSIDQANCTIYLTPRKTLEVLESQLALLGISEEDLSTAEERKINSSMQTLLENLEKPETTSTPFYSREG